MRALVDTNVLLWWLAEPTLLSKAQFDYISSKENQVLISAATIWEVRIKEAVGKIEIPSDLVEMIADEGFTFMPITVQQADNIKSLPNHHKDPFDRLIIAQAIMENIPVLTSDKIFKKYSIIAIY